MTILLPHLLVFLTTLLPIQALLDTIVQLELCDSFHIYEQQFSPSFL